MVVAPQKPGIDYAYYGNDFEVIDSLPSIYKVINENRRSVSINLLIALGGGGEGCLKALIIHNFMYWMRNGSGVIYKGRRWVYNTIQTIASQVGASYDQTRRVLESLRWKDKVLIGEALGLELNIHWRSYQTLFYAIDFKRLLEIFIEKGFLKKESKKDAESQVEEIISDEYIIDYDIPVNDEYSHNSTSVLSADMPEVDGNQPGVVGTVARHNINTSSKHFSKPNPPTPLREREKEKNSPHQKKAPITKKSSPRQEDVKKVNNHAEKISSENKCSAAPPPKKSNNHVVKKSDKPILKKASRVEGSDENAPWSSREESHEFRRKLVQALAIVANCRSPEGLTNGIMESLRRGESHSYWDDFKAGDPIGTRAKPEWEVTPGEPYPLFLQYLEYQLGGPHDTDEQKLEKALDVLERPKKAFQHWKQFLRKVELRAAEVKKAKERGVSIPAAPVWMNEKEYPTVPEAAAAANYIQEEASTGDRAISEAKEILGEVLPSVAPTEKKASLSGLESSSKRLSSSSEANIDKPIEKLSEEPLSPKDDLESSEPLDSFEQTTHNESSSLNQHSVTHDEQLELSESSAEKDSTHTTSHFSDFTFPDPWLESEHFELCNNPRIAAIQRRMQQSQEILRENELLKKLNVWLKDKQTRQLAIKSPEFAEIWSNNSFEIITNESGELIGVKRKTE